MTMLMLLINLAACGVIWAAAMHFYLRHGRPRCARQHFGQVALVLITASAFAAGMTALKGIHVPWWDLAMRVGFAMLAGKKWFDAWRDHRKAMRA